MKNRKLSFLLLNGLLILSLILISPSTLAMFIPPPGGGGSRPPEKIAVFFWASDICADSPINKYINYLKFEGYTKFFKFKDSDDFEEDFNDVDDYERSYDTIFFYLAGHGSEFLPTESVLYYNGLTGYTLLSNQFRRYMDRLETPRKAFLVCSCYGGGFVVDFQSAPYLAMSATDWEGLTYSAECPGENYFSLWFFYYVRACGYNAEYAFYMAKARYGVGNPQIADYSDYIWFAD